MKKILLILFTLAWALVCQAQINGSFMGLKMGFSSMEDAIYVFKNHGIQYQIKDALQLSFKGRVNLEGCWASEGVMVFLNDQLALLIVITDDCEESPENCRQIKHTLKNKYQHLEDDNTNQMLQGIRWALMTWAKTDGKHSVFYAYDDDALMWGYAIYNNEWFNSVKNK